MRIQLDTKAKVIRLEDKILLKDLVVTLEKLLPKKEWQTFTLETNTVINNWNSPVVIREYKPWSYPWYTPMYSGTNTLSMKSNVIGKNALQGDRTYNIEC